jgi:hypothetical protein
MQGRIVSTKLTMDDIITDYFTSINIAGSAYISKPCCFNAFLLLDKSTEYE